MKLKDYVFDISDYQDCLSEIIMHNNKHGMHSKEIEMILQASMILGVSEILCLKQLIFSYMSQVSDRDCRFCKSSIYGCKMILLQESL